MAVSLCFRKFSGTDFRIWDEVIERLPEEPDLTIR